MVAPKWQSYSTKTKLRDMLLSGPSLSPLSISLFQPHCVSLFYAFYVCCCFLLLLFMSIYRRASNFHVDVVELILPLRAPSSLMTVACELLKRLVHYDSLQNKDNNKLPAQLSYNEGFIHNFLHCLKEDKWDLMEPTGKLAMRLAYEQGAKLSCPFAQSNHRPGSNRSSCYSLCVCVLCHGAVLCCARLSRDVHRAAQLPRGAQRLFRRHNVPRSLSLALFPGSTALIDCVDVVLLAMVSMCFCSSSVQLRRSQLARQPGSVSACLLRRTRFSGPCGCSVQR